MGLRHLPQVTPGRSRETGGLASGPRPLESAVGRGGSTQSGRRGPRGPCQHQVLASRQGPGVEGEASPAGWPRGHFAAPGEAAPIWRAPGDGALLGHGASTFLCPVRGGSRRVARSELPGPAKSTAGFVQTPSARARLPY